MNKKKYIIIAIIGVIAVGGIIAYLIFGQHKSGDKEVATIEETPSATPAPTPDSTDIRSLPILLMNSDMMVVHEGDSYIDYKSIINMGSKWNGEEIPLDSEHFHVEGTVDTSIPGEQHVTYVLTDDFGQKDEVDVMVFVMGKDDHSAPVHEITEEEEQYVVGRKHRYEGGE